MPSQAITINSISWTPITSAGQDAICWMIKNPAKDRVLIDHSDSGIGALSYGKSYSIALNKEVITDLIADNPADIFYAICKETGENAILVVDDYKSVSSTSTLDNTNSSETPLDASAEFTGDWAESKGYGIIYISVYSDVDSAIDGLKIEQSIDGVNADFYDIYSIIGTYGKNFSINPHARFYRVRYINGTSAQTVFRLQTKLNAIGIASSHRVKDDITTDDDARLVKSILAIKANDQEQYKNIEYNNPIPVNGDQTYPHDVNIENSVLNNFSGSVIDIFDNKYSYIQDTTATNPKIIRIEFERPISTQVLGFATDIGSFSNLVIKYGTTGTPDITLIDLSTDSSARTVYIAPYESIILSRLILEFHTANTVTLQFLSIAKNQYTIGQIQGQDPSGNIVTFNATRLGNFKVSIDEYGDTASIDAFSRLRVADPHTIYDSKQLHDNQPLFYDEAIGGSATSVHNGINASVVMTVTANSSDYIIRQTKQRFNYQPGKSQLIIFTLHAPQQTGVTSRAGYFDGIGTNYMTPNNGVFLQIDEDNVSWNIAKNGTTTESVNQADWNYDKLDGTGPSGITLDADGLFIALTDIEWLGAGRCRCGFVISGIIRYVHYFTHTNTPSFTSVYMSTPNLPIRYDVQSDGTGGGTLDHICATVMSEGGIQQTGILRSIDTENTHLDANAADQSYVLLALRLKTNYLDITVLPEFVSMISETNDDFRWSLHINPTYSGTLTYTDITDSACQRAVGTTTHTITAEGVKIDSGYAKSSAMIDRRIITALTIGSQIDLTRDELILAAKPLASNADLQGSLTFRELL